MMAAMNWFSHVPTAPPDKIYYVQEAFVEDKRANKINVSIGVYRDSEGNPFVPPSVREAEKLVLSRNPHKEYSPIEGFAFFRDAAAKFIFGNESSVIKEERHATVQGVGGTGSLRVGALFLYHFLNGSREVFVPDPTWTPHSLIFSHAGFTVKTYRYWNREKLDLDFDVFVEDVSMMPSGSILLLHAVAQNPTGTDPNLQQWKTLSSLIKEKQLYVFIDSAYQGLSSGDAYDDGRLIRMFAQDGHQFTVAQTFSKNMGLYGERIGSLSIVCGSKQEANSVMTQLKKLIRPIYSHPANHGARIATEILTNNDLYQKWLADVRSVHQRITEMRQALTQELVKLDPLSNWDFINKQVGLFCLAPLSEEKVLRLRSEHAVYVADDGRINVSALNQHNVQQFARALIEVQSYFAS